MVPMTLIPAATDGSTGDGPSDPWLRVPSSKPSTAQGVLGSQEEVGGSSGAKSHLLHLWWWQRWEEK
jgi:hypothetical protein